MRTSKRREGPPFPMTDTNWNRRVWRLAGPIILANLAVPMLGAVDTAVMGHLPGPQYIGAVAVGAVIVTFVYWGFGFLRMGTTGLTAQALGAGNADEVRATLARALILATGLGLAVLILQQPIGWFAFTLIKTSSPVAALARDYYDIRIWSGPFVLAHYALTGWFIGLQNTRAALILALVVNGTNIVLDLWFVFGLGWGVKGVALASVISEVISVAVGLLLVRRNLTVIGGHWRRELMLDGGRLRRMIAINRDIFIRTLCLKAAFAGFTAMGARFGDVTLAANAVLMIFQSLMAHGLDGFAHAVEALAGSALGGRDRDHFRAAVRATSRWALYVAVAFALIFILFGGLLIDLLTITPEVRAAARTYLPWLIASPLISMWSFQLDGIFIGATWTREMRNAMVLSLAIYAGATAIFVPLLGNHGLWLAMMVFMVARAVTLGCYYPKLERRVADRV